MRIRELIEKLTALPPDILICADSGEEFLSVLDVAYEEGDPGALLVIEGFGQEATE